MSCSNCYNGCSEVVSDKCAKYTGIDYPVLGIKNGDSLSHVNQALIQFLISTLDGTGIKIDIASSIYCELVNKYMPTCGDVTIVDISKALIQAVCDLQTQITANGASITSINSTLSILNADYNVSCLTGGVVNSSDTHLVVQALINNLCTLINTTLPSTYVKIADLDGYIQDYLDTYYPTPTQYNAKMIPYTVVEYYAPNALSNFDGNGAGRASLGFDRIYLCNGQSVGSFVLPDKRGRVGVGAFNTLGNVTPDPEVNPYFSGSTNPNYAFMTKFGTNFTTLTLGQIPSHTHTASGTFTDTVGHHHGVTPMMTYGGAYPVATGSGFTINLNDLTKTTTTSFVTGSVNVTNAAQGGGQAHTNIQPVLPCYYIMYVP